MSGARQKPATEGIEWQVHEQISAECLRRLVHQLLQRAVVGMVETLDPLLRLCEAEHRMGLPPSMGS
jgi:hypothetical protein